MAILHHRACGALTRQLEEAYGIAQDFALLGHGLGRNRRLFHQRGVLLSHPGPSDR